MIDSTTINFALSKFDSLTQKALPYLKEGGMALVDYKVLEVCLNVIAALSFSLIFLLLCAFFGKKIMKLKDFDFDDVKYGLPFSVLVIFGIVCFAIFIIAGCQLPSLILALKHPVIYTILDLAGK